MSATATYKKVLTASKEASMPKKKPGVYTAKNGAKYKILANGKARFISGPTKRGGKRKGGAMHRKGGGMGHGRKGGGMGAKTQHIIY